MEDDGHGGADPSLGSGLRGIERRVAAFDGVLAVNSPAGGPTLATVELPRAFGGGDLSCASALPPWKRKAMNASWGLFWLPLFPQGLVPMFFKLFGVEERSWFLALHLPGILQWPVTPREREVLELMAEGRSNAAIAQRLYLSEPLGKHTANIFAKLGLAASDDDNRRVLAVLAYLNGTR